VSTSNKYSQLLYWSIMNFIKFMYYPYFLKYFCSFQKMSGHGALYELLFRISLRGFLTSGWAGWYGEAEGKRGVNVCNAQVVSRYFSPMFEFCRKRWESSSFLSASLCVILFSYNFKLKYLCKNGQITERIG
jgi:hypothetical protein